MSQWNLFSAFMIWKLLFLNYHCSKNSRNLFYNAMSTRREIVQKDFYFTHQNEKFRKKQTNKQGKNNDCTLTISNVIIFVIIFIIIFFIIDWSTLGRNCTARSGVRAHLKVWNETCRKLWIVCNLKIEFIITFDIYLKAKLLCFLSIGNN